ncbi:MAG: R2-like ligand-binding oxidase [Chloroflexi bacterium]|nr:R2-like ligand-binding oxidase [Chloroflexota bacterium]MBP8054191.1 R2-like ligand-binding oxidase [Chloroflexota bacterium]
MRDHYLSATRGLQRQSFPMRLFEKAKRFGIWNPSDLDFSQDKQDWQRFTAEEKDLVLRLTTLFQAGEEAVTLDLLPLIQVIAQEGRIEEEMYLTTFLFEEAKHVDFFRRVLDEVAEVNHDLSHYLTPNYATIFNVALPQALQTLRSDHSPIAQARAAATYNMIVEGVLAETGYYAYYTILKRNNIMPGQLQGITYTKQDESRHIAYGLYLLSRLIACDRAVWDVIETTMSELMVAAAGVITDAFSFYDPIPFGLNEDEFIEYAWGQFQKRYARLEQARGQSLEEIMQVAEESFSAEE